MKYLLIAILLMLTGCAGMPPQWLANYYDNQDPCLQAVKNNTRQPSFCGAANSRSTTHVRQTTPTRYEIYNK